MEAKRVADSRTEQTYYVRYPYLNSMNRLFGGQLLSWIDEVAGLVGRRHSGKDVITACIDNLHFKSGANLNDMIVLVGRVTHVGSTSIEVRVDTYREDNDGTRTPINRAYLVMVAIGEDGKPSKVPGLLLENPAEEMEWENAVKRRELRLKRKQEGY